MSTLKRLAKRVVVHAVARVAPITWRWRRPGSLVVLMYHRVLPKDSPERQNEQPGMYVSPETLDLHLTELKRHFELVHLDDWLRRAKEGKPLPRRACALTFDDGWRDNYDFALPVLVKHQAPATIFLVSSYIGTTQQFWPNRLLKLIRTEVVRPGVVSFPPKLRQIIDPILLEGGGRKEFGIEDFDPIVQQALKLEESEIRVLVDLADANTAEHVCNRQIVNLAEIERMSESGLIRFGSHSATHFRVYDGLSEDKLSYEIVQSRTQLQAVCDQPIELFCYPNGRTSDAAITLVAQHYLGAVITETGWHSQGANPYTIPRIRVHDDVSGDSDSFVARLFGWP